jgi:hypothetical protein
MAKNTDRRTTTDNRGWFRRGTAVDEIAAAR